MGLERVRVFSVFSDKQDGDSSDESKKGDDKMKVVLMSDPDPNWPSDEIESIFENVKSETQNPNNDATYYEQYIYKEKTLVRLGDCIYVKEPQFPKPRIARVDRLWTDAFENVWFHGPWFIECNDTKHEPTRIFHKNELSLCSDEASINMSYAVGKCVVLPKKEYQNSRPTEIAEEHI